MIHMVLDFAENHGNGNSALEASQVGFPD